eukprot:scaffold4855_cov195-Amphora_coffeaeformis.AAC.12
MKIGAQDVVPAVEMAVRFMNGRPGERVLVWSHSKYAYGLAGRQHGEYTLPAESNVAYEIEFLRKQPTHDGDATSHAAAVLQFAQARKDQANDMYQTEWFGGLGKTRIQQAYNRIQKDMEAMMYQAGAGGGSDDDNTNNLPDDIVTTAQSLRIDALNNVAAVLLRAKDYHAAKAAAVQVLEIDPHNFKALIRAAKAALMDPSSEFAEVEMALQRAAEHANDDAREDVMKLTAVFVQRKKAYEQASKQIYQKAFASSSKQETKTKMTSSDGDATLAKDVPSEEGPTTDTKETTATASTTSTITYLWNNKLLWNYILPYGFQLGIMMTFLWIFMRHSSVMQNPQDTFTTETARQPPPQQSDDEF